MILLARARNSSEDEQLGMITLTEFFGRLLKEYALIMICHAFSSFPPIFSNVVERNGDGNSLGSCEQAMAIG
jgi:hypothetical protein